MCLAIPMKIQEINADFAIANAAGNKRKINIKMISSLKVGDFVLVHAGFAIEKIDPKKALATLSLLRELYKK